MKNVYLLLPKRLAHPLRLQRFAFAVDPETLDAADVAHCMGAARELVREATQKSSMIM